MEVPTLGTVSPEIPTNVFVISLHRMRTSVGPPPKEIASALTWARSENTTPSGSGRSRSGSTSIPTGETIVLEVKVFWGEGGDCQAKS